MKTDVIVFSDRGKHLKMAPLSLTRPVAHLRMGVLTFEERWKKLIQQCTKHNFKTLYYTEDYLSKKYPMPTSGRDILLIDPLVVPDLDLVKKILNAVRGEGVFDKHDNLIAAYCNADDLPLAPGKLDKVHTEQDCRIDHLWQLYQYNKEVLQADFALLSDNKKGKKISTSNTLIGDKKQVFIEKGAKVEGATINVEDGPVYIGENAEVMEGTLIRGGLALCNNAVLKMGAKIYGATTIGPYSKIGGEVNNSVFIGYSNKAHDGFMGNSVIGSWCNLGADTNTSNLKNNYSNLKIYSYASEKFEQTEIQFCGLIMGDHSKCGINTMFNTGTVVGINANIFGAGFPPKYVAHFYWGGKEKESVYELSKALEVAKVVFARRDIELTAEDENILTYFHPDST